MSDAVAGRRPGTALSRLECLGRVASSQDVVRDWLAQGQAEVCVAVVDEQTAGRGRRGRRWHAPSGVALLVSAGFRPTWLPLERAWRLSAVAAMAMLEAASSLIGRDAGLALKWPNDLVVVREGRLRKVGGLLAEGEPGGERLASAVVGLGVNVDWPADAFPADLAAEMGSLVEIAGAPVDRERLLEEWLTRLLDGYGRLSDGSFDGRGWSALQATTGAHLVVETTARRLEGSGLGVDLETGALLLREARSGVRHALPVGDVTACRVSQPSVSL
jgi:BirA family biotin operon repressor/biotin-[acetyl-CoA-carboxylase] ligase